MTAVEWLSEQIYDQCRFGGTFNDVVHITQFGLDELIKQAKQMEKKQMEKCFLDGDSDGFRRCYYHGYDGLDFEQYYNETYGKENSN